MSTGALGAKRNAMPFSEFSTAGWAGDVQIQIRDGASVELRYFDDPERFRRWMIPLCYVIDLVRWWSRVGCTLGSSDRATDEVKYGAINVAILSSRQIYFRGRSPLGRPNITGFQLPRPAVEALSNSFASQVADSSAAIVLTRNERSLGGNS